MYVPLKHTEREPTEFNALFSYHKRPRVKLTDQRMHRFEARMRLGLLNEEAKNIKPLNDTRWVALRCLSF